MYVAVTGKAGNKDVYIYESFRKPDGKTSSRIHRKLGKYNDLLRTFDDSEDALMAWARRRQRKIPKNTGRIPAPYPLPSIRLPVFRPGRNALLMPDICFSRRSVRIFASGRSAAGSG